MEHTILRKVLLISYYFEPFNGVGAKRLSYWAHAFMRDSTTMCKVLTATPQETERANIVYIEDPSTWANKVVFGASWISPLKKYIKTQKEHFDFVIISGGPFGHFGIVHFLKKKFVTKVLLDFRDPFSGNIRFQSSFIMEFLRNIFERRVTKKADHILTVNGCCRDILRKNAPAEKISVIENGYDERVVDAVPALKVSDGRTHIVHAGRFYVSCIPFAKALVEWNKQNPQKQFILHHIGEENDDLISLNSPFVLQHGVKSYPETIQIMKTCSVGLLLTSGELLEYNTKIFDYIGCHLDIFIITDGIIETGCIHDLTKQLGRIVFWSTAQNISSLFDAYTPIQNDRIERNAYSRKAGFQKLLRLMDSMQSAS